MHKELVTAKPVVNIFLDTSEDAEVGSQTIYGWSLLALEQKQGWIRVRTADGYEGWVMHGDLIAFDGPRYADGPLAVHVCQLSANLYRDADATKHAPLMRLPWEARLSVVGAVDGQDSWLQVRLVDDRLAYVHKGDVCSGTTLSLEDMLQLAHRFIGVTYTWGGISSFGFDCSGYTQMLLRQRGMVMPRDAADQVNWSALQAVEFGQLEPGDLLYFSDERSRIVHTGLYLGRDKFIHSTRVDRPGVQVSRLRDSPWKQTLVAQRRAR